MEALRLAQFSDLHLGANLAGGKLALPHAKAQSRRREQRECLARFAARVRESRPAAVLVPGDLFDTAEPNTDDLNFAINTVNSMSPVPVLIAPGNHDGYAPSSCYNTQSALYQSRRSGPKWGRHVHIFTAESFETVPLPGQPDVTVTGAAFHRHLPDSHRALAELPRAPEEGLHLLVFHGSLLNYPRAGDDREVLPFAATELERAGYRYAAVGHYHRGGAILGERGQVLGAYAGAPFATSLGDQGAGSWLEVELPGRGPLDESALHWHRCDERAVVRVELDLTGLTDSTAIARRLDELLAEAQATKRDLVHVTLRGRLARGVPLDVAEAFAGRFFHLGVDDSAVEPDYAIDLDGPAPEPPDLAATSQELFTWRMRQRYQQATTDEERALIKEALCYGLDALDSGEIHLR